MKKFTPILFFLFFFSMAESQAQSRACNLIDINITPSQPVFCPGNSVQLSAKAGGGGNNSILDQSQTVYNGGTSARNIPGHNIWQSFTAGITGTLVQIDMGFFTLINGTGQLNVYYDTGVAGPLLWSQTVSVVCGGGNCLVPFQVAVPVIAGQAYTFQFVPGVDMPDPFGVQVDMGNGYPGGDFAIVDPSSWTLPGWDMVFNTYVSASGSFSYLWSNGDGDAVTVITSGGEYYITVTDSVGCTGMDTIFVLEDSIRVYFDITHTTCGNPNGSIVLATTGGIPPMNIDWSNTAHTDTILNLSSGTYSVTITDSIGCSVVDSAVVNASGNDPVIITADNAGICPGDSVRICAPSGFVSYSWSVSQNDSCITTQDSGTYRVTVTDAGHCTAESNHLVVNFFAPTLVIVHVNGNILSVANTQEQQWYLNGNPIPGADSSFYIATQAGSYRVSVIDSNGCPAMSNPVVITGMDDLTEENGVNVFPNPSQDGSWQLIVGSNLIGGIIEMIDANGRVVFKSEIRNPKSEISPDVSRGIYLLRIHSHKSTVTKKLVRL